MKKVGYPCSRLCPTLLNFLTLLQILSVGKDQFGKYTCEASNRHGTASQHMELYESQVQYNAKK